VNRKYSANAGFFGQRQDRFNQYQPARTLEEKFTLIAQVEGLTGIELKYPSDLQDFNLVRTLCDRYGLVVAAVNVDTKDVSQFLHGALSAQSAATRQQAAARLCEGMDVAAALGVDLVTTCPISDGYDYAFQVDFVTAWGYFIETVRQVVAHRSDVSLLLEYQPHEPHARNLLNNVGKVLHVCAEVNAPNLGANLDIGHSFAAGESPAEAVALLASKGLLRYIHTNDNTGDGGDWDMVSGTVHFWHWLETLYTLERVGYDGWFGADIMPKHMSPVEAYRSNIVMLQRMSALVERLGMETLTKLTQSTDGTMQAYQQLLAVLLAEV
jgi:xylose isomerase